MRRAGQPPGVTMAARLPADQPPSMEDATCTIV